MRTDPCASPPLSPDSGGGKSVTTTGVAKIRPPDPFRQNTSYLLLCILQVPAGHNDVSAVQGQSAAGLVTYSTVSPCHNSHFSGQIFAMQHLQSRAGGVKMLPEVVRVVFFFDRKRESWISKRGLLVDVTMGTGTTSVPIGSPSGTYSMKRTVPSSSTVRSHPKGNSPASFFFFPVFG